MKCSVSRNRTRVEGSGFWNDLNKGLGFRVLE